MKKKSFPALVLSILGLLLFFLNDQGIINLPLEPAQQPTDVPPVVTTTAVPAPSSVVIGRVVGISDGDTIKVLVGNQERRVRLEGVDTPERKQPFGTRAKQFTADLCFGRQVELRVKNQDRYGRDIARVIVDGRDMSRELVANGLASGPMRWLSLRGNGANGGEVLNQVLSLFSVGIEAADRLPFRLPSK